MRFSKEEEEQRERVSSFEKKERQTEPIFLRTETGNYCQSSITLSGKKRERERERDPPRVNSPPLEKAPREREEERIALVDTQKQR